MKFAVKLLFMALLAVGVFVGNNYLFEQYVVPEQTRESLSQVNGGQPVRVVPYQAVYMVEGVLLALLAAVLLRREIFRFVFQPERTS
jgi:hypothetical protein